MRLARLLQKMKLSNSDEKPPRVGSIRGGMGARTSQSSFFFQEAFYGPPWAIQRHSGKPTVLRILCGQGLTYLGGKRLAIGH